MAALGAWIMSAFGGIISLITMFTGRKLGVAHVLIAAYAAIVIIFAGTMNGLISQIVPGLPSDSFILAGLSLVPSKAPLYVSTIGTAYATSWLYLHKEKILKFYKDA